MRMIALFDPISSFCSGTDYRFSSLFYEGQFRFGTRYYNLCTSVLVEHQNQKSFIYRNLLHRAACRCRRQYAARRSLARSRLLAHKFPIFRAVRARLQLNKWSLSHNYQNMRVHYVRFSLSIILFRISYILCTKMYGLSFWTITSVNDFSKYAGVVNAFIGLWNSQPPGNWNLCTPIRYTQEMRADSLAFKSALLRLRNEINDCLILS